MKPYPVNGKCDDFSRIYRLLGTRRSLKAKSPTATIQVATYSIEQGQNKFVITRYTLNMKSRH